MKDEKEIVRKWYRILQFPQFCDRMLEAILAEKKIEADVWQKSCEEMKSCEDTALCLIFALFKCEELERQYIKADIPQEIFLATIEDIKVWSLDYYDRTGQLGLQHLWWLMYHLDFKLFQLGRLQFNFTYAITDCPTAGLKKGDPVLGVHIPKAGTFTPEVWEKSFEMAHTFFATYFPQSVHLHYTCNSWFLSPEVDRFLGENSHVRQFKKKFQVVMEPESDIMLSFVFSWGTKAEELPLLEAHTSLQKKIKEYVAAGGKLHSGYGIFTNL